MITITERASKVIKEMQENMEEEMYLRFSIKRPCCSQMHYSLGLAAMKSDREKAIDINGITLLIDPADSHYTDEAEIDYLDGGFIINNPNPLVSPLQ